MREYGRYVEELVRIDLLVPVTCFGPAFTHHLNGRPAARLMASAYASIGRNNDAIAWTHTAIGRGFINDPFLSSHDS